MCTGTLEHVALAAPGMIQALGNAGEVLAALGAMGPLVPAKRLAALGAVIHAYAHTVGTGALALAAQMAGRMLAGAPHLALQRVIADAMLTVAARRVVLAQAQVAHKQTAHLAGNVLLGILAGIGCAAALAGMLFVLLAQGVLGFVGGYNDYFGPLIYLKSDYQTLQIAVSVFSDRYSGDWPSILAANIVAIIPTILIYIFVQRYFIEGITAGGEKG